jgi:hypothetical protein
MISSLPGEVRDERKPVAGGIHMMNITPLAAAQERQRYPHVPLMGNTFSREDAGNGVTRKTAGCALPSCCRGAGEDGLDVDGV